MISDGSVLGTNKAVGNSDFSIKCVAVDVDSVAIVVVEVVFRSDLTAAGCWRFALIRFRPPLSRVVFGNLFFLNFPACAVWDDEASISEFLRFFPKFYVLKKIK